MMFTHSVQTSAPHPIIICGNIYSSSVLCLIIFPPPPWGLCKVKTIAQKLDNHGSGWIQVSLGMFCLLENRHEIVLYQY